MVLKKKSIVPKCQVLFMVDIHHPFLIYGKESGLGSEIRLPVAGCTVSVSFYGATNDLDVLHI